MTLEYITLRTVLVKNNKTEERQASVLRTSLGSLLSKPALLSFILKELFGDFNDLNDKIESYRIERKSKKHKKFVALEEADDFKELMRSLRVKNHVKLVVYQSEIVHDQRDNTVTDTLDQIRRLAGELQKSEIWEALRSFSTVYGNQVAPDGSSLIECIDDANDKVAEEPSDKITHQFVACDSCHPGETFSEILGKRYKCTVCKNFDLCEKCYAANITVNEHLPDHPMLAIPDSRAYKEYSCGAAIWPTALLSCGYAGSHPEENTEQFESLLKRIVGSNPALLSRLNECLDRSRKYCELENLLPDSSNKFDDLKDAVLKAKTGDVTSNKSTEDVCSLFTIKNASDSDIPPGDVIFDFFDSNGRRIATDNYKLGQKLYPGHEFSLLIDSRRMSLLTGAVVNLSLPKSSSIFSGIFGGKVILSCESVNKVNDSFEGPKEIELTVVPKGTSLSQIILANKSDREFKCDNLNFEIVNCFGKAVASVSAQKKHDLLPGRFAKFNVLVNNTHFKYPFRVTISNDSIRGSCELSLKSLTALVGFSPIEKKQTEIVDNGPTINFDSNPSFSCFDDDMSDTIIQCAENMMSDNTDEDFDIISISDADDIAADFEVLSNINSYEE